MPRDGKYQRSRSRPSAECFNGITRKIYGWKQPPAIRRSRKRIYRYGCGPDQSSTGFTDEFTVQAFYSEPLFSLNDLDGLDPRRHYVQPGRMTSYILHLRNPKPQDQIFHLQTEGLPRGWKTALAEERVSVKANDHKEIQITIMAPNRAGVGETGTCRSFRQIRNRKAAGNRAVAGRSDRYPQNVYAGY